MDEELEVNIGNRNLSQIDYRGVTYDLVDQGCRNQLGTILNNQKQLATTIDLYRNGIIELAESIEKLNNGNDRVYKSTLSLKDTKYFPILKFYKDFSVEFDIVLFNNNSMYSSNNIIKYYNDSMYHSCIDSNIVINFYYQKVNDFIFLVSNTNQFSEFDLNMTVVVKDGSGSCTPDILYDNKFSIEKYPNLIKIK